MAKTSRPCERCGDTVYRTAPVAPIPSYCDKPTCYKRCSIEGCEEPGRARTWCNRHYNSFKVYGDPLMQQRRLPAAETCSVSDCLVRPAARGFCHHHYKRWAKHGDPLAGGEWPPAYTRCAVDDCDQQAVNHRGWCQYHYHRWHKTGDPTTPSQRIALDDPRRPICKITDCEELFVTNGMCGRHDHNVRRTGSPTPPNYEWSEATNCKVCGDPPGGRFRQFCSYACWGAWRNYLGEVPLTRPCASCGTTLDFLSVTADGTKRFRAHSYCKPCRRRYNKWGLSVTALAIRDGAFCGLCGCDVDMAATRPDVMCPSVDHILPRSRGGTDDPENLQLAHLLCNIRKGNRLTPK